MTNRFFDIGGEWDLVRQMKMPDATSIRGQWPDTVMPGKYYLIVVPGYADGKWYKGELYRENNPAVCEIHIEEQGLSAEAGADQVVVIERGQTLADIFLSGEASGPKDRIDRYEWTCDGDVIGTEQSITAVFGEGAHQAKLTVYDYGSDSGPADDRRTEDYAMIYIMCALEPPGGELGPGGLIPVVRSWDPNEKVGPAGHDPDAFVEPDGLMPYIIYFENDENLATAPAQEVRITDTLDPDLDWSTFELTEIVFGDHVISIPAGRNYYATTFDLRPYGTELLVEIEAGLDPSTGEVSWRFVSLDPKTLALTDDPLAGFLPVNDETGRGEGHVSYIVRPKAGLSTGDQIINSAAIVFDVNEPIVTNTVLNTIDADKPSSQVDPLPGNFVGKGFVVSWAGQDEVGGSGVASFDVYVSRDGGPWERWLDGTAETSALFSPSASATYAFYSRARDNVGHVEEAPAGADAAVVVVIPPCPVLVGWQLAQDSGVDVNDKLTNDATPVLTFTFSKRVFGGDGDVEVLGPDSAVIQPDSITGWGTDTVVVTFATPLTQDGAYCVILKGTATITDEYGIALNNGDDETVVFVLDTTAPLAPVVTGISDDTGLGGDGITSDQTLVINGTAEANHMVEVFIDDTSIGTTAASESGAWSFDYTGTALTDGAYFVAAQVRDAAGNASAASAGFAVRVDTIAPAVTIDLLTTSDPTPRLTGTVNDASAAVRVTVAGASHIATNNGDGTWTLADNAIGSALSVGTHDVVVTVTDVAGNVGTDGSSGELTIRPQEPAAPTAVDSLVSVSLGLMSYDRRTLQTKMQMTITNTSQKPIYGPVWIVIKAISDSSVRLMGGSGTTSDGYLYLNVTSLLGDGRLDPGERITTWLSFSNPLRRQFNFSYSIRGLLSPPLGP